MLFSRDYNFYIDVIMLEYDIISELRNVIFRLNVMFWLLFFLEFVYVVICCLFDMLFSFNIG